MWQYGGYYGWGFMGLTMIAGMVLFWGAIIWLIVWLVNRDRKVIRERPLDILQRRYARGEITRKEYEDMKKDLDR